MRILGNQWDLALEYMVRCFLHAVAALLIGLPSLLFCDCEIKSVFRILGRMLVR